MVTISQLLGKKSTSKIPPGDVGLEFELEFLKEQQWDINPKAWEISNDEHSLRNIGYEITASSPIEMSALDHLVISLCENINARKPIECNRTSTHVHLNMLKSTILQVLNCAVVYWLLETPLTRYCGEEREGHHFNLRLKDAEALVPVLCESLESEGSPLDLLTDRVRYAGLNLNALLKFGSLEFRSMRGTTDPSLVLSWTKGLHHLCSVAKTYASPAQVFDSFLACSKEEFVRKFLPEELANATLATPGYEDMMDESASILCALAYAQDWIPWAQNLSAKIAKRRKKPSPYEQIYGISNPSYGVSYYDDI